MRALQALLAVALVSSSSSSSPSSSHSIVKRESESEKRVVCYYTNWSVYRPGTAKYNPQNINPYLCTHLIYAFGGLDRENGLRPYDKYQDIEQGGYAKFTGLKSYNKNLKTMLAIGGWNEGSARFSPLVADDDRRKEFVKNVVKFLRVNHFDGLDLDWEYPAFRDGGKPRDRDNYAQLVQELREEFDREHDKTGRPRLLLTMAVPAGIEYIDKGYDVPKLNKYLDFMNILSYDYHSAFEPAVNHHSPLFSLEEDNEYNFDAQLSIDYTVKHYLKAGADRDKLVLGIPTYGRSYTLFNPDSNEIGAAADGPGEQGDATREKGYLAYYEICSALKNQDDWTVVQPKPSAMGPYAFRNNQWVGYDDVDIVKLKSQYVNDQGLGGIMFWSIDNDDFRGQCHERPYPLIEAAKEAMFASSASTNNLVSGSNKLEKSTSFSSGRQRPKPKIPARTTTTTPVPSRAALSNTTPQPPTTPDPGSDFVCKDEGFFPHPRDCKKYFWCLDSGPSNLGIVAHQFTCPSGLFFNKAADSCDYTRNVLCNKKEKATTAAPKVTAATSKTTAGRVTTTTTTTTTTTEAPIEEEYEEEEEEEVHEQEDPEAIKQLIKLIKKLGGVAELEKQLEGAGSNGQSTPSIPRSLYNKVIPQGPRYQSIQRNGPSGPQNEGLSQKDDGASYRRDKPQYVTIRRERPSTEAPEEETEVETPRIKYSSIQRNRPGNQYEVKEKEEEEEAISSRPVATSPRYQTIERSRPRPGPSSEDQEDEERFKPKYSSIQRNRPTTVETVVENTTPRYVTLRRQRPQVEQQHEESTINHTGETIVIEAEEEIKPIEIDVEEPITTSVRPKIKVSERPVSTSSTTESLHTTQTDKSDVLDATADPSTVTDIVVTMTNSEGKETTESSSQRPTTVPYQTSTLTSIVTVVVEGATERRRVPLTKLKQALADHDLLTNSLLTDLKYESGKISTYDKEKLDKVVTISDESNHYRPIGNFRGRPRKPIVVEAPTTKALPLYLQRRRTTSSTVSSIDELASTEDPNSFTRSRASGRFTPSRTRERGRARPSSTQTIISDDVETSTQRTRRFRTSAKPLGGGSRFGLSRGRTRTTTSLPDKDEQTENDDVFENRRRPLKTNNTISVNNRDANQGYKLIRNRGRFNSDISQQVTERPTRVFSRSRVRPTTESSLDPLTTETPSTRSRYVINRNKKNSSTPRTRLSEQTTESSIELKNDTNISSLGRSRFQIQKKAKPNNDTDIATSNDGKRRDYGEAVVYGENRVNDVKEKDILITQENVKRPNEPRGSTITIEKSLNEQIYQEIYTQSNNTEHSTSIEITTLKTEVENGDQIPQETLKPNTTRVNDDTTEQTPTLDEKYTSNKNNFTLANELEHRVLFNDTTMPSSSKEINKSDNNDTFDNSQPEGEVLNVIASQYSEQSFTGTRGTTRFQGMSENDKNNLPYGIGQSVNSVQSRRRKINNKVSEGKSLPSKIEKVPSTILRKQRVLVRKNMLTTTTEEILQSTTEYPGRVTSRYKATKDNNGSRSRVSNLGRSAKLNEANQLEYKKPENKSTKINQRIGPRGSNNNIKQSTTKRVEEFTKITTRRENVDDDNSHTRRKVKVLKSRSRVNSLEEDKKPNEKRRRVVVKKNKKELRDTDLEPKPITNRRGSVKYPDRELADLDTGTSLFVQSETDEVPKGSFTRSVKEQLLTNSLNKYHTSRGNVKARHSLLEDISGVTDEDEDSTDEPTGQSEVGNSRVRVGYRRPAAASSRSRPSPTTEAAQVSDKPTPKLYRRRVTKLRNSQRNSTSLRPVETTSPVADLYEPTSKPRRFEFPRRTARPNINLLPEQAALVATIAPFVEIQDNHSDESLHEVDTETVENKELYQSLEQSTLPDLANVAVAALQSLATAPPSTESFAPVTASNGRRQTLRPTTTTTTTVRPRLQVHRGPPRPFSKVHLSPSTVSPKSQYVSKHKPYDDLAPEYDDYYAEPVEVPLSGKVRIHSDGYIECLDIGNFPHPFACRKFISCAKMESEHLLGWEYTCPKGLSFDPIGGICNWSAGLGCKE